MLGTTTKLSNAVSSSRVLGLLKEKFFLSIGLTITEINVKKYRNKTKKKILEIQTHVGMEVCKQGRDDIK